ncbi:hypothetical protein RF11_04641 [Thelohanellus kitauei]|uniref:Uncharacterized protein n=1 Tax=Thelohanellus kitauei TaxID=669202 RepID=A0A0C2J975_THEKT|nr:hypothetical protein RF11_04641 [Thelohanellus kitauei]
MKPNNYVNHTVTTVGKQLPIDISEKNSLYLIYFNTNVTCICLYNIGNKEELPIIFQNRKNRSQFRIKRIRTLKFLPMRQKEMDRTNLFFYKGFVFETCSINRSKNRSDDIYILEVDYTNNNHLGRIDKIFTNS